MRGEVRRCEGYLWGPHMFVNGIVRWESIKDLLSPADCCER